MLGCSSRWREAGGPRWWESQAGRVGEWASEGRGALGGVGMRIVLRLENCSGSK